ncbi:hypothetical protein [Spirosoma validum]|uniref:Uncharacterized protein n=1 Tax=Spirosoma validum TaxID=2771355 RepID=A0A927GCI0_9BACT|nr:hypothetical protein [Spirosoma validum]MBD2752782.1 hypothetical protein [Spirosoma validum]
MKELAKESWNYTLSETESGELIFRVVSGSVGLYDIKVRLTADEISHYKKQGKSYLATLANDIRTHESRFASRKIAD